MMPSHFSIFSIFKFINYDSELINKYNLFFEKELKHSFKFLNHKYKTCEKLKKKKKQSKIKPRKNPKNKKRSNSYNNKTQLNLTLLFKASMNLSISLCDSRNIIW